MSGNNVSHAHNKTRRRFLPNLHTQRFWLEDEKKFIKLKVSRKGIRMIEKLGTNGYNEVIRNFSLSEMLKKHRRVFNSF